MPNSIATEERAKVIAAHLKAETPILEYPTREIENRFEKGTGATVDVITVDYGSVIETADGNLAGQDFTTSSIKTPVTVSFVTNPVELNSLDQTLNIASFEEQIVKPRISLLASRINAKVIATSILAANDNFVVPTGQKADFQLLANVAARVRSSKVGDRIAGAISYDVQAAVTGSGMNMFSANNSLGSDLYRNKISQYAGIDWVVSADCPTISNPQVIAGATLAGPIANGSNQVAVTLASGGANFVIPKFTPFTIAGINSLDAYGKDTGKPRTFVVIEDATGAGSLTRTLKVAPVWSQKTDAGLRNATSLGAAGAQVAFPLAAGTYYAGSVFASKAVAFASIKPAPLLGSFESANSNIQNGLNVLMTATANGDKFTSYVRWDVLVGSEPLYQQGAVALYVPAA
jgi:hypothetical protein